MDGETIRDGRFGLIQQFGAGVENIDIAAATSAGVWVANMPGLNAIDVAEHAVLLLLALLRRLPESSSGFDSEHWGDPPGEALAGSTVCIVGLGAVGSQLARRLVPFEVRLIGVRRDVRRGAPPTTPGAGLDVFTREPYPSSGPLARHPKVIATAHNAALTASYFRRAARALGEALTAQLDGRRPPNALNAPAHRVA